MLESEKMIQEGIALVKAGKKTEGRTLLTAAVQQDPNNEEAWLWLGAAGTSPRETISCLKRALAINPKNQKAAAGIKWAVAQLDQARRADTPSVDVPAQPPSADRIARSVLSPSPSPDPGPSVAGTPPANSAPVLAGPHAVDRSKRGGLIPNVIIAIMALTLVLGLVIIAYLLNMWLG